ncbi:MAG: hypothetical protein LBD35_03010 [Prevotellaceae bacterium]|jgi:hypothetical protein|nr:hypothetical protein [Prevotellaceae bacterium]
MRDEIRHSRDEIEKGIFGNLLARDEISLLRDKKNLFHVFFEKSRENEEYDSRRDILGNYGSILYSIIFYFRDVE